MKNTMRNRSPVNTEEEVTSQHREEEHHEDKNLGLKSYWAKAEAQIYSKTILVES